MKHETTRMGLRAALAAALALGISALLGLQRSYWAVLVAVVLVNETWGDSVQRAVERVGMTGLGCLVGALLHVIVAKHPRVEASLLLVGIFFTVYFRKTAAGGSYQWMIFFVTVYVVFLFAVLGRWSVRGIVLVRLYDTAIGGVVALAASFIVRPPAARRRLERGLLELWRACRAQIEAAFRARAGVDEALPVPDGHDLFRRLESLRAHHRASVYEDLLVGPRQRTRALVQSTEALCDSVLSLSRALIASRGHRFPQPIEDDLAGLRDQLLAELEALLATDAPPRRRASAARLRAFNAAQASLSQGCIDRQSFTLLGAALYNAEVVSRNLDELWTIARPSEARLRLGGKPP